jgi:hypothetical protein
MPATSLQWLARLAQSALLAAVYFTAAKASLLLAIPPGYASPVWPPSGIGLAALLIFGNRLWPGIWVAAAVVNYTVNDSIFAAVSIATGNTLEALAGATLIRRSIGVPHRFERGDDVVKFVAFSAASATIAPTVGLLPLSVANSLPWDELVRNWLTWCQGDITGIVIVAPLLLTWSSREALQWNARYAYEGMTAASGVVHEEKFGRTLTTKGGTIEIQAFEPAAHVNGGAPFPVQRLEPAVQLREQGIPLPLLARLHDAADHLFQVGHGAEHRTARPRGPLRHNHAPLHQFGAGHADRPAAHRQAIGNLFGLLRLRLGHQPAMDPRGRRGDSPERPQAIPQRDQLRAHLFQCSHAATLSRYFNNFNNHRHFNAEAQRRRDLFFRKPILCVSAPLC